MPALRKIHLLFIAVALAATGCGEGDADQGGADESAGATQSSRSVRQGTEIARLVRNIGKISLPGSFGEYDGARRKKILYSGAGVDLEPDGGLRVSLEACPAGDCAGNGEKDWRLVALDALDPGMVYLFGFDDRGVDVSPENAESVAVAALCKAGPACVARKDGRQDKRLLIPCEDPSLGPETCDTVVSDLKALLALHAGKPMNRTQSTRTTSPAAKPANDLVGVWAFESPFGERIRIEFRADGQFFHTHPVNTFQGTWTASNGTYAIIANQGNYEDGGTYRLTDTDTVVFDGRFGRSVWRRQ